MVGDRVDHVVFTDFKSMCPGARTTAKISYAAHLPFEVQVEIFSRLVEIQVYSLGERLGLET